MDTLAQKNQTFEPIRHTFHIVYVTAVATSWTVFQKAKKTSGRGTHKYDEPSEPRISHHTFSPREMTTKATFRNCVCSSVWLERGFYHEFFSSLVFQAETKAKARVECPLNNAQGKMDPTHLAASPLPATKQSKVIFKIAALGEKLLEKISNDPYEVQ